MIEIRMVKAYQPLSQRSDYTPAQPPGTLEKAKLPDMFRSMAAAAVDKNSDGVISAEEYSEQIIHAGGSVANAGKRYASLDSNKDGSVSTEELAASFSVPKLSLESGLLSDAVLDVKAGMNADMPSGMVLDAAGEISDPLQILRYLAHRFPGNLSEV